MYDEIKHAYTSLDGISLSAPTTTTISKRESKQRLSRSSSVARNLGCDVHWINQVTDFNQFSVSLQERHALDLLYVDSQLMTLRNDNRRKKRFRETDIGSIFTDKWPCRKKIFLSHMDYRIACKML